MRTLILTPSRCGDSDWQSLLWSSSGVSRERSVSVCLCVCVCVSVCVCQLKIFEDAGEVTFASLTGWPESLKSRS